MDSRTGELLAIADDPTFDANEPTESRKANLGSRAMQDVYEPGSVQKVLTAASLLDLGLVTPRTKIVVPPLLQREDSPIGDWFPHGTLHLTLAGVIANAVASALSGLGVRTNELPLSPDRVWTLIERARREAS